MITSQCIRDNAFPVPFILSPADLVASKGPGLTISALSLAAPGGISVQSENIAEGVVTVIGVLPLVGTVGLEGVLPSAGAGVVDYICGDILTMLSEELIPVAPIPAPVIEITQTPELLAASNGAGLIVSSGSACSPGGVSVASDNAILGEVILGGALPFLGTVGVAGFVPTGGAGAVNYNCGYGVGIISEDLGLAGVGYGPSVYPGPYAFAGPIRGGCGIY